MVTVSLEIALFVVPVFNQTILELAIDKMVKNISKKNQQMEDGLCFGPWNEYFPMYFNDYEISDRAKKLQIPLPKDFFD